MNALSNFKFKKTMDIQNSEKQSVGSLMVNIKMKHKDLARGNKREQGTLKEVHTDNSNSVSLEEEEYEEDYEEEPEIDRYNENYEDMKRIEQNEGSHYEEQNENYMPSVPAENQPYEDQNFDGIQDQQYENIGEGDEESSEDPIPDDEDNGDINPSSRNPEHMSDVNKKRSRNQILPKQNFRSTSDKDKRLNIHKKTFKNRKFSNRHFLKDSMTPLNFGSKSRASRNNIHNMSHAQTQYSPNSLKEYKLLEKRAQSKGRKKYKSKGRMVPSQSYGHQMRIPKRFGYQNAPNYDRNHGQFTPLVGNFVDHRFSTFDHDFEDESEQESFQFQDENYTREYFEFEKLQRLQETIESLKEEKEYIKNKFKEFKHKQNNAMKIYHEIIKEREIVEKERETVEKERLKMQIIKKEISQQVRILKKKIDQANKLGLKHNNSAFLRNLEAARQETRESESAGDNLTTDHAYTDIGDGSPLPSMNRQIQRSQPHYQMSDMYDPSVQRKFTENYDIHAENEYEESKYPHESQTNVGQYDQNSGTPYQENYPEEEFPPKNSSRNLTKAFNQEAEGHPVSYNDNLNRSYESDKFPSHAKTQQISEKHPGNLMLPQNEHRQNYQHPQKAQYSDPNLRYAEDRKPRFTEPGADQPQYMYDLQRSQERQSNPNNLNPGNFPNKSPVMYMQNNMPMQPQFIPPDAGENAMGYNGPYQQVNFVGGPYGEMSFHKDFPNPNNLMSGSSTDRLQNKGNAQGLHNYISGGGNPLSTNGQNSAYNSGPGGQDASGLSPHPIGNKEYSGNPPTFHPFNQMAGGSQLNSQTSAYTPPQITPKQNIGKFQYFEGGQNQVMMNSSNGIPYDKYREMETQNSFSIRDRQPQGYGDLRESINENSTFENR